MFYDDDFGDDSFWDSVKSFQKKENKKETSALPLKQSSTNAVEVELPSDKTETSSAVYRDQKLNLSRPTSQIEQKNKNGDPALSEKHEEIKPESSQIHSFTRYIPPFSPQKEEAKPVFSYEPDNMLIKKIEIFGDESGAVMQKDNIFFRERSALLHKTANEAPYARFYSVSPRYTQLTKSQLNWYLWWRENARQGIYLQTDKSYVLLYIYELLTATKDEDLSKGLCSLCDLIRYFESNELYYPFLYSDIIADYCMIHGFNAPVEMLQNIFKKIVGTSTIPVFYVGFNHENREIYSRLLPEIYSLYNYRKSKLYTEKTKELFETHIPAALRRVFMDEEGYTALTSFSHGKYNYTTIDRHPFRGIPALRNTSLRIRITCYPLMDFQEKITNAARYAENRLRVFLGYKSMLNILALDMGIKKAIDKYMDENLPYKPDKRRKDNTNPKEQQSAEPMFEPAHNKEKPPVENKKPKVKKREAYEVLYDLPKHEISIEAAAAIEKASWDTTRVLIETFADSDTEKDNGISIENDITFKTTDNIPDSTLKEPEKEEQKPAGSAYTDSSISTTDLDLNNSFISQFRQVIGDKADFILACIENDAQAQKKTALVYGLSIDGIADEINEASYEILGDILLEEQDGKYVVIDDYLPLLRNN